MRHYSLVDQFVINLQNAVSTLMPVAPRVSGRPCPAAQEQNVKLTESKRQHVAGLMRVNHSGEICAQALYQGQALTARLEDVRNNMEKAAEEEIDHLAWCEQRLVELNSHPSMLNPVWYAYSFLIGAIAGLIGDRWSLGFVAETERQVVKHLSEHLAELPLEDNKSRKILQQMQKDEAHHATIALDAGGEELPEIVKQLMAVVSKIMTQTAYYV